MIDNVVSRIEDLNTAMFQTTEHRHRILLASAENIKNWFIEVREVKAIYTKMNLSNFDVTQKCLIAECWCPNSDLDIVRTALRRATQRSGSSVPSILNRMDTSENPTTFNRTNKFIIGFQNIVDAFRVSKAKYIQRPL
jgi:V-type H+-transporting ATPase subunit a